jgi:hypothetical protein
MLALVSHSLTWLCSIVGRYLSNVPGSSFNKKIQPGELGDIFSAGLRVFPIFQTYGDNITYFTNAQGKQDAKEAVDAASLYGFSRGTPVYFAVSTASLLGQLNLIRSIYPGRCGCYRF